jgi:hypothetical protein
MELALGLVLIVVLYARTFWYNRVIDDKVPMSGYLYDVPNSAPEPGFYLQRTPAWHRVLAIGCHLMNTWLVYLILGGKAALLFAVFPVSVNNVAWITGSYYSCTTMLTLIAFYFLTHLTWWIGIPAAAVVYAVALNTTICTIAFPFVFMFGNPIGLALLAPLAGFFMGKRWNSGVAIREGKFDCPRVEPDKYSWGRFAFSIKLLALYLYTALAPLKLLFFRSFGSRYRVNKAERDDCNAYNWWFFGSVALISAWIVTGFVTGKLFWAMWFLVLLAPFCQIKMLGQVFAERYIYPAAIGLCAVLAQLPEPAYWMLVGLYVMRTHMFIPAWENCKKLYENGIEQDPKEASNYCNLSDWYLMTAPDMALAGWFVQKNIQVDPEDYKGYVNFSSVWRRLHNPELALKYMSIAKEKATGVASPYIHSIIDRQLGYINEELAKKAKHEEEKQLATV